MRIAIKSHKTGANPQGSTLPPTSTVTDACLMACHHHPNGTRSTHRGGTVRADAPGTAVLETQHITGDHVLVVVTPGVRIQSLGAKPESCPKNTWRPMMARENTKICPDNGSHINTCMYVMSCHLMSWYCMICYGNVMECNATQCNAMQCNACMYLCI